MNTTTDQVVAFSATTSPTTPGWRTRVGTLITSSTKFRRRRLFVVARALAIVALTVWLVVPTGTRGTGDTVTVTKNLDVLSVNNGYNNRLFAAAQWLGMTPPGSTNRDRIFSATNAYGVARELVTGEQTEGYMLAVDRGSQAWESGLRDKDIVTAIDFPSGCDRNPTWIRMAWVATASCPSQLTISRDGTLRILQVPTDGTRGAYSLHVRSDVSSNGPRQLNMTTGLSAGLGLSLLYTDRLTEGSLFSADHVAVTGAIDHRTGLVTSIGGLPAKAKAAYHNGATILLVPTGQSSEVPRYPGVPVYEVGSTLQAVQLLCLRGANDEICERFSSSP